MNTSAPKRIVIVDGYSTARDLLPELLERNVLCIHLQSTAQVPADAAPSFDPRPYDADLGYIGEASTAIAALAELEPDEVIAGSEWGVTFAEAVAHGMGLPTNRIGTIGARRNKFEMIEALRRNGLRAAEQVKVTRVHAAHAWADRHGRWPVVVKPLASAGAEGVAICRSHDDIDQAFAAAFGRTNSMGGRNDELLLQSYLTGPQFIVNAVSRDGRHYVTDVWRQTTAAYGDKVVPRETSLLDPTEPTGQALIDYTLDVLPALGIENGASHSELKWTPAGPTLIETGARLMGAAMDRAPYRHAGVTSQAMAYAQVLSGTARERDALFARRHYSPGRPMTKLLFDFRHAAEVRGTNGLARLRDLSSFHAHYRALAKGARIPKTTEWLCCGGVIYLVHDEPAQIDADIARIRAWEQRGELYELASLNTELEAAS